VVVGLVWVLALLMSGVILFQAVRSVWRSGRTCLSAVESLGEAASAAAQTWDGQRDPAAFELALQRKTLRTVRQQRGRQLSRVARSVRRGTGESRS
jgi:hypothetical protein